MFEKYHIATVGGPLTVDESRPSPRDSERQWVFGAISDSGRIRKNGSRFVRQFGCASQLLN